MNITDKQYEGLKIISVQLIELDRANGIAIKYDDINGYIDKALRFSGITCDETTRKQLFTEIEYQFKITHSAGHSIFNDYDESRDWYTNCDNQESYFWRRYRRYLSENTSIDITSINLLDNKTLPDIMNCLGNPLEELTSKQLRRGLIIGDVQSGKTATYSGLICKAADAGYKVIVLLAGITESLRMQTQERIDQGIIGFTRIKDCYGRLFEGRVGVGNDNQKLKATSLTSCVHDFVKDSNKIATTLDQYRLVVFVVKKNVSVLTKLYNWLFELNVDPVLGYVDLPMLLIDDEADNASVNTNDTDSDPTKTNEIIRKICDLFKNTTYVGFTATPFANVFIDPDSVDEMNRADLFPEHFIYTLPTPSSYIGADKIFYEEGIYHNNIRYIYDVEEPDYLSDEYRELSKYNPEVLNKGQFYSRHKKEWRGVLPDTLKESILCFFLSNVIRDLRHQKATPRSMLINMSRFINVQNYIKEHVEKIWKDFVNTVRFDFSDDLNKNKSHYLYQQLLNAWESHFSHIVDVTFEQVVNKHALLDAVENISIVVVNGSKAAGSLDYRTNKSLRVIAIGGLALSRGLTLEGLLVSYFYRNTSTFDVLMQMGRWFGYRSGYEDIFQIWTSRTSADWYAEISRASQELKTDIGTMFEQRLTPKDFGIRVRDNSSELQITSANKMRKSFDLSVQYSYYGDIVDTPYVSMNTAQNKNNWNKVNSLVEMLTSRGFELTPADKLRNEGKDDSYYEGKSLMFQDVPKNVIIDFLGNIKCSLVNMKFNVENICDFIRDESTKNIEKWDVVFEGGDSDCQYDIDALSSIKCATRAIYPVDKNVMQISSRRRILGTREGKFALTKEQLEQAESACRKAWGEKEDSAKGSSSRSIPLRAYFEYLPDRKPILIIMLVQPSFPESESNKIKKIDKQTEKFVQDLGNDKIVAFAVGFPGVKSPEKAKKYKVNKTYRDLYMVDENDEIIQENEE